MYLVTSMFKLFSSVFAFSQTFNFQSLRPNGKYKIADLLSFILRQLVICLKITVNAMFLSWISLKKSAVNSQGLIRLSNDSASRAMYKERENKL